MVNEKVCEYNKEICPTYENMNKVMLRFENKLDGVITSTSNVNTRLSEFLARHEEQNKTFKAVQSNVKEQDIKIRELELQLALAKKDTSDNNKDIDKVGKKLEKFRVFIYTGTISGLMSLLILLLKFILSNPKILTP